MNQIERFEALNKKIEALKTKRTRTEVELENKKEELSEKRNQLKEKYNIEFKNVGELKNIVAQKEANIETYLDNLEENMSDI